MPSRGEAASEDETTARKTTKNQSDKWCRKRDSNPRPRHYELQGPKILNFYGDFSKSKSIVVSVH